MLTNETEKSLALHDSASQFLLASLIASYPPQDFSESADEILASGNVGLFKKLLPVLEMAREESDYIEEIRSKYIDIFERGRSENSLYESEYGQGRSFAKGTDLVDISGFYRAFGFAHGQDGSIAEMPDHVAVELEFYALMCLKELGLRQANNLEGVEIVFAARKKFMEVHLGRFVKVISLRPRVAQDAHFGLVFSCIADLVEEECRALEITPQNLEWFGTESENEEMLCGSLNKPVENAPSLVKIG